MPTDPDEPTQAWPGPLGQEPDDPSPRPPRREVPPPPRRPPATGAGAGPAGAEPTQQIPVAPGGAGGTYGGGPYQGSAGGPGGPYSGGPGGPYSGGPGGPGPYSGGPGGPGGPYQGGPGRPRPPRGPDNRVLLGVVIGLGVALVILVILLVLTNKGHKSNAASTTSAPTSTSTTSTSSTTTSTSTTSTSTTSTTSTTEAPTTTVPQPGTHAPTVAQTQQISASAMADPSPACQPTDIFIADSDPAWAALRCTDPQSQQHFLEVRQQQGSSWVRVSLGTAQVDCTSGVPKSVQADFASVLGACPS